MASRTNFVNSMPGFVVDWATIVKNSGRQVDWTKVGLEYTDGGFVVQMNGAAIATAVSLTVDPLKGPVKAGTLLNFTGPGEVAVVTTDAALGATTIAVEPLDAAIEDNDTATVPGTGKKKVPAGTPMAEDATNHKIFPRTATAAATGLLATDALEDDRSAALTGYGVLVGGVIYQNLLPVTLDSTMKTELQATGTSTGFYWETYEDDRAS